MHNRQVIVKLPSVEQLYECITKKQYKFKYKQKSLFNMLERLRIRLFEYLNDIIKENTSNNFYELKFNLSSISKLVRPGNLKIFEKLIYILNDCGWITLRYTGGYTRSTRPGPNKIWRGFNMSGSRADVAARMLFYIITIRSKTIRSLRRKHWYKYIEFKIYAQVIHKSHTNNTI